MNNVLSEIKDCLAKENLSYTVSDYQIENLHEDCIKIEVTLGDRLSSSIYVVERVNKLLSIEINYKLSNEKVLARGYDEVLSKELNDLGVLYHDIFDSYHGMVCFLADGELEISTYIKGLKEFNNPKVADVLSKIDDHLMYLYERHSLEIYAAIFDEAEEEIIRQDVEFYKDNLIEIYGKDSPLIPLIDEYEDRLLKGIKQEKDKKELAAIIDSFEKEIKKYKED